MKIGIDISQIVYSGTGVATYTKNLVEKLVEVDKKNKYILFGSSLRQQKALKSFMPRTKHVVIPLPPTVLEPLWNRLHFLPIETFIGKTDVFHTSDWSEPPTKAPKVTTIHDLVVYKFPGSSHSRIIAAQKRKLEWVKREEKAIIAVSQSTKKDVMEVLGIPQERIKVVYEAADKSFDIYETKSEKERIEMEASVREKYDLKKKFVLAVGTREPRRNLERLIKAFEKIKDRETELVIVGNRGWGKAMKGDVRVLGYVSQEDLPLLYGCAQAFAHVSLYEGFGIPILEALKCGCPVVASNISSMPEVGGKAAIYTDPLSISDIAEKLEYLMNLTGSKRAELLKLGIAQAEKFSWEKAAKETIKIYEEVA